jgi:DNA-binding NtrC family response regulator
VDENILIGPPQIMGKSPGGLKLFRDIRKIATQDGTVLIAGESGTCKRLVAMAIHTQSARQKGPFVVVSLSSIPKEFTEAELFGYGKGGLTDTSKERKGKIEEAKGGTLFLDEISELDMHMQERLCNLLQGKEAAYSSRKSASRPDVRIIGATSKNLKNTVTKGQFREDLFKAFRTVFKIPSLRERKEDIVPLAGYFLNNAVDRFKTGPKELSREARDFLVRYDWPGNIRELESTIKKAAILSNSPIIGKRDLLVADVDSCSIREFLEEKLKRYLKEMTKLENCNLYDTVLSEVERSLIAIVLRETEGNQLRAAKILGINRNTLRAKIREYKIRI